MMDFDLIKCFSSRTLHQTEARVRVTDSRGVVVVDTFGVAIDTQNALAHLHISFRLCLSCIQPAAEYI